MVLDVTPFYAEGGGQVGDSGTITGADGQVEVTDVQKTEAGVFMHYGRVVSGRLRVGDAVLATVDEKTRTATQRHHTATHLLHAALHRVLGDHAEQAGSLVAPDRLRFDFTHFEPLTERQIHAVERLVNEKIMEAIPVTWEEMSLEEARRKGAKALFGEKYGEHVRVVGIGDYSLELCGGTHMNNSGEIGPFKIISEGSVAAGVRRIEAVAGDAAWRYIAGQDELVRSLSRLLQAGPQQLREHVDGVLEQVRRLERERDQLKRQLAAVQSEALLAQAEPVDGAAILATEVEGADAGRLDVPGRHAPGQVGRSRGGVGRHGRGQSVAGGHGYAGTGGAGRPRRADGPRGGGGCRGRGRRAAAHGSRRRQKPRQTGRSAGRGRRRGPGADRRRPGGNLGLSARGRGPSERDRQGGWAVHE